MELQFGIITNGIVCQVRKFVIEVWLAVSSS
jgi:hypothetical protein